MDRFALLFLIAAFAVAAYPQSLVSPVIAGSRISDADLIAIVKAEDSRHPLAANAMLSSQNAAVRYRAALAAGRIGSDTSLDGLAKLLADPNNDVRAMAAFAIGEIESAKGSDAILSVLNGQNVPTAVVARAVEAAGKIAAANPKDERTKDLGKAIVRILRLEAPGNIGQDELVTTLALTAALRARPEGSEEAVARLLDVSRSRVVADAGNTLARLRAKNANTQLRRVLTSEIDGAARANAARALGAAEDKDALPMLLKAADTDRDVRVRVSAIRAVAGLKDAKAVDKLLETGRAYVLSMNGLSVRQARRPEVINELLEIATALSRLVPSTENENVIRFLNELRMKTNFVFPETEIALARVAPKAYVAANTPLNFAYASPRQASAFAQGLGDIAQTKDLALIAKAGEKLTDWIAGMAKGVRPRDQAKMMMAMPDFVAAMAALKPNNLNDILLGQLKSEDVFVRAAAAGALADLPANQLNIESLKNAYTRATLTDKHDNDAKVAILDALAKLDKKQATAEYLMALNDPDYLIRKKGFDFLSDATLYKDSPGIPAMLEAARSRGADKVKLYTPVVGTKLGQLLNTDVDYRRALSRSNGSVSAVLTTEKGAFTIVFNPEEAPLTVDNFVKLARTGYFNGLEVHRVVPNFVMQDGDPRGDGNGGPGWSIRCEINMLPYDRGAVGMALSGKDTGGSQWFVTHSPQPHLDGGYTVFGHVSENDMKVVDSIVRGDKIIRVRIIGR